jgi:hypothetical protein
MRVYKRVSGFALANPELKGFFRFVRQTLNYKKKGRRFEEFAPPLWGVEG